MKVHRIAVVPGDGIGKEVVPEGIRVLEKAGELFGIDFKWEMFPWSCETYLETGRMMPEDGMDQLKGFDAIFLGAVGFPGVPDHVSLWGLLIPIRRELRQYINLRPVRMFKGMESPSEGPRARGYRFRGGAGEQRRASTRKSVGGSLRGPMGRWRFRNRSSPGRGVDRVLRYAFELARQREARHVTSATKSNGIIHTMPFWDERFAAMADEYPDIQTDQYHIDILTANFVLHPDWFDVVVGSNLFGDILSDLGPAVAGTIGVAPSANINPTREFPSMFEPVHGSAPDIAGKGIANPIGQIWSGALMLDHLGHPKAAAAVESAIETVLDDPHLRTPDMGGKGTTVEVGKAIESAL